MKWNTTADYGLDLQVTMLMLFQLKGCPYSEVTAEVDNMITVLHLEDKRDVASSRLSGGMKRKLSVGIALIAGSKVTPLQSNITKQRKNAERIT